MIKAFLIFKFSRCQKALKIKSRLRLKSLSKVFLENPLLRPQKNLKYINSIHKYKAL